VDGITVKDSLGALHGEALIASVEEEESNDSGKGADDGDHNSSDGGGF